MRIPDQPQSCASFSILRQWRRKDLRLSGNGRPRSMAAGHFNEKSDDQQSKFPQNSRFSEGFPSFSEKIFLQISTVGYPTIWPRFTKNSTSHHEARPVKSSTIADVKPPCSKPGWPFSSLAPNLPVLYLWLWTKTRPGTPWITALRKFTPSRFRPENLRPKLSELQRLNAAAGKLASAVGARCPPEWPWEVMWYRRSSTSPNTTSFFHNDKSSPTATLLQHF